MSSSSLGVAGRGRGRGGGRGRGRTANHHRTGDRRAKPRAEQSKKRGGARGGNQFKLNQQVCQCSSANEVLDVMDSAYRQGLQPSAVNVATALHRVAKHAKRLGSRSRVGQDGRVRR